MNIVNKTVLWFYNTERFKILIVLHSFQFDYFLTKIKYRQMSFECMNLLFYLFINY